MKNNDVTLNQSSPLRSGVTVITEFRKNLPSIAGVYRMINRNGDTLYVGKAKSLNQRVLAYTRPEKLPLRLQRMVSETANMEVITTHTEAEALLLEANLIKKLAPKYNILLRDDKSFAFILLARDHDWPQIVKHRGVKNRKGQYFGPFPSASSVNQTLSYLQRAFLLRSCSDTVFSTRTRPCLLYQIKRCSAPCVDKITSDSYGQLVEQAQDFLSGKNSLIQTYLASQMEKASLDLDYETAALYRDRIRALTRIQAKQSIVLQAIDEADAIALYEMDGTVCLQVFFFRAGCHLGNRSFFPSQTQDQSHTEIMKAFLSQFYQDQTPPKEILLSHSLADEDLSLLSEAFTLKTGRKITLSVPQRGDRKKLLDHASDNARQALARRLSESATQRLLLEGLSQIFDLDQIPERIEIYDNSHLQGTSSIGAMVVAGPLGFEKNAYRKFNLKGPGSSSGDDFAMMQEVIRRRFRHFQKNQEGDPDISIPNAALTLPDLLLIDGGEGQLKAVYAVLTDLGLEDIPLVAISKGLDRDAGRERFHRMGLSSFTLPPNDPHLYFLQRLRDEAHRFAIGTHRAKRSKSLMQSPLDSIDGIGVYRKRALLRHFGSAKAVSEAGLEDLEAVDGISKKNAEKIYNHFRDKV
jgi:excinuclease ABC subunit C